ncbi:reverse transcriptase domain-containing protein [Tanacetum coccineum]
MIQERILMGRTELLDVCTYSDFLKCQTLNFKGTEGVMGRIALMWSKITTLRWYSMICIAITWKTLKKMMTDKYCPRGEIKKIEIKMWNLKVKGTDVVSYNQRFQELSLMCSRMFPEESDEIEKYVGGLPDMIYESVMASKPKTMREAIEFATELMDKKISTFAERHAENKKKLDKNNQAQQQPPKKQGVAIAYTVRPSERKEYAGTLPLCNKCKFHHTSGRALQRNLTCYECGNQGHYRSDCPELKNQNHGNRVVGTGARGMVHALGGGETNQDLNQHRG